jgi:hypothetical protein
MITADLFPDHFAPEAGDDKRLTTWYAQGQSDALGDRLLMFDNTNAPSWEILRFKPALAREPRFEAALRQRVELLAAFQHDSFPQVRPIKRLGHDDGLAVVSTYSGGASLSEALRKPRSPEFALRLIRQLVPALTALQRLGPGMAHGALTVDRISLNADGRLMIREHMVGAALESLEWPAAKFWSELGVLVPRTPAAVKIDERTDIAQLALIVLSLMAGRRIGPDEYPDKTNELLDDLTLRTHWQNPANPAKFQALRHWLERALQLSGQSFSSAHEAHAALAELQEPGDPKTAPADDTTRVAPKPAPPKEEQAPPMWSSARGLPPPAPQQAKSALPPPKSAPPPSDPSPRRRRKAFIGGLVAVRDRAAQLWRGISVSVMRWAIVGLAVLVIVEAVFIGRLMSARSTAPAVETKVAATPQTATPSEPQTITPTPATASVPLVVPTAAAEQKLPEIRDLQPPAAAAAPVRNGGFRVSAPIELHVLDGERVVGSSVDGPIMAAAGRREYDFVNSAINYRVRQAVDVRPGQIVLVTVPVPNGRLNINAQPWAAVSIDGNSVGETPLGDLSVVPGEHEILFRHPQLGDIRQKVIVRSGVETRVTANLQK